MAATVLGERVAQTRRDRGGGSRRAFHDDRELLAADPEDLVVGREPLA